MNFDKQVNRLGTHSKQWDYVGDRFGANDLLPFTIADMDISGPPQLIEQLRKRIDHGIYGYTKWEHDEFLGAIQKWYDKRFETTIKAEEICYSPSVIYSISKLIGMLSESGDHVVLQTPAYDGLFAVISGNDRVVSANQLVSIDGHYVIDFHDLEEKLAHKRTKIFLLCSPHNPTGRVYQVDELKKMLALCEKYGVFVISDEVHMDVLRHSQKHLPVVKVAPNREQVCVVTSANKTFNTPGLIGSYAIIPNGDIRQQFAYATREQDGFYSISSLGMTALIAAYEFCGDWVDALNVYLEENMKVVADFIQEQVPEVGFVVPESTYLGWLDLRKLPYTSEEIQKALVEVGKVAIVSGEVYGPGGEGYLRFNIGCSRGKVEEGLRRFKVALDSLK